MFKGHTYIISGSPPSFLYKNGLNKNVFMSLDLRTPEIMKNVPIVMKYRTGEVFDRIIDDFDRNKGD